jgi:hypothetical protein
MSSRKRDRPYKIFKTQGKDRMKNTIIMGCIFTAVFISTGCEQKKSEPPAPEQVVEALQTEAASVVTTTLAAESVLPNEVDASSLMEDTASTAAAVMETVAEPIVFKTPTVKDIQTALKNAGLYDGSVDGSKGPMTDRAIRNFQSQSGLKVDGKVGPQTWAKLSTYLATQAVSTMTEAVTDPLETTTY